MIKITIEIPGKDTEILEFKQMIVIGQIEGDISNVTVQAACSHNFIDCIKESDILTKVTAGHLQTVKH